MVVQTRFFSCRFSIPHAKQRPTTAPRRTARVRATAFPARPWSDAILMLPRVIEGRSVDPNWCARSDDKSGQSRPPKAIKGKSAPRDNRQDQTRHPKPQGWNIPGIEASSDGEPGHDAPPGPDGNCCKPEQRPSDVCRAIRVHRKHEALIFAVAWFSSPRPGVPPPTLHAPTRQVPRVRRTAAPVLARRRGQ